MNGTSSPTELSGGRPGATKWVGYPRKLTKRKCFPTPRTDFIFGGKMQLRKPVPWGYICLLGTTKPNRVNSKAFLPPRMNIYTSSVYPSGAWHWILAADCATDSALEEKNVLGCRPRKAVLKGPLFEMFSSCYFLSE